MAGVPNWASSILQVNLSFSSSPFGTSDIFPSPRWWTRGDRKRGWGSCLCLGAWAQKGQDTQQLQAEQRFHDQSRHIHSLVWLARFQRWRRFRCKHACRHGGLELHACRWVWWYCLVRPRLSSPMQVQHGWILFWSHYWLDRGHVYFGICPTLGSRPHGNGHRRCLSFRH